MKKSERMKSSTSPQTRAAVSKALAPVARPQRVADQVYRHLRRAIVGGKIAPGTRLRGRHSAPGPVRIAAKSERVASSALPIFDSASLLTSSTVIVATADSF